MLWARKLTYRGYRGATTADFWIRRRLTRPGYAVLGGLLITTFMSFDTEQRGTYQLFAILAVLMAISVGCSPFFRARFAVERSLPRFGSAGCPLTYHLSVRNLTRKVQPGLLLLENMADPRPTLDEFVANQIAEERRSPSLRLRRRFARRTSRTVARPTEQPIPTLPPGGEMEVKGEIIPLKRGVIRFDGVTVARPDPFGLFKSFISIPLPQSLLILPRRYYIPPIALPGTMKFQQGGVALASSVGESEEFVALRDYRAGDALRHIHWRSWAKAGKPIVKEFQEEFFVRHALILDTFHDLANTELFEEAVSTAASFACAIQTQESLLDLMFVGPQAYCFTSGRGLAHADQMLEILAAVRICRDKSFESLTQLVLNHLDAVSGCICIFLAWDRPRQKLVERLKIMGLPLMVLIIVEPGDAGKHEPGPLRDAPECFHVVELGKVAEKLAAL
jgi:uncharacterized protein (DUF58 family)